MPHAGPKQTVKILPGFGFEVRTSSKKRFFEKVRHLVLIYTPKEAHSRIFVTGGSVISIRATNVNAGKKNFSWRGVAASL